MAEVPFELDSSLRIPAMEAFGTTFGVELEMRPHGYYGDSYDSRGPRWENLCRRLLRADLIDPAKREVFTVNYAHVTLLTSQHHVKFGSTSRGNSSSAFWKSVYPYFRTELKTILDDFGDSCDAGGDELKSPILTTNTETEKIFRALYTILPHFYDFTTVSGCGMHIHVGRNMSDPSHITRFERFMISREWLFQLMVPQYRRHGYNRVWRTDTLAALIARRAVATSRTPQLSSTGSGAGCNAATFDGDIQALFYPTSASARAAEIVTLGSRTDVLQPTLPSTHGHWICGDLGGRTTEFRLFAPPADPRDIINWIRLLNHVWLFTKNHTTEASQRSHITPFLSADSVFTIFDAECPGIPSDLSEWMREKHTVNTPEVYG